MYKVYKHTFPNGKCYIGITQQNPERRWLCGNGYKHNQYMLNAVIKYGWNNIKHEILFDNLTKEEVVQKEIELIAFYKSNQREYGYNIEAGGNYAGKMSDETKKKISISRKGRKMTIETKEKIRMKNLGKKRSSETIEKMRMCKLGKPGKKRSEEHNRKLSIALTGKKRTIEQRQRISNALKGIKKSDEAIRNVSIALKGKRKTEETKKRMSLAAKGKTVSIETREKMRKRMQKKVKCIETNQIFDSFSKAAEFYNLKSVHSIALAVYDKSKTARKYHWSRIYDI